MATFDSTFKDLLVYSPKGHPTADSQARQTHHCTPYSYEPTQPRAGCPFFDIQILIAVSTIPISYGDSLIRSGIHKRSPDGYIFLLNFEAHLFLADSDHVLFYFSKERVCQKWGLPIS